MAVNNFSGSQINSLFAAGKNKVLNGDFGIWQRGTSFTNPAFDAFLADRWKNNNYDNAPTSFSVTRETFTPGTAPVAGYEGQYFFRSTITTVGTNTIYDTCQQRIEDVRTLAGQTATLSFWAKADSARTVKVSVSRYYGTGGSASDSISDYEFEFSLTTSWQRFSVTFSVPNLAGKTVGPNSFLWFAFRQASASGSVLDLWGVQLEAGSVATPFTTATGNPASELAACQRYYQDYANSVGWSGYVPAAVNTYFIAHPLRVEMRTSPTVTLVTTTDSAQMGTPTAAVISATGVRFQSDSTGTAENRAYFEVTRWNASAEL